MTDTEPKQIELRNDATREFLRADYCGFWLDTPDGSIWAVGDSRLLQEQLDLPHPDAMLFDFSDSRWHIGFEGAVKLANAHPDANLILWHWGSVDAPDWEDKLRSTRAPLPPAAAKSSEMSVSEDFA